MMIATRVSLALADIDMISFLLVIVHCDFFVLPPGVHEVSLPLITILSLSVCVSVSVSGTSCIQESQLSRVSVPLGVKASSGVSVFS